MQILVVGCKTHIVGYFTFRFEAGRWNYPAQSVAGCDWANFLNELQRVLKNQQDTRDGNYCDYEQK